MSSPLLSRRTRWGAATLVAVSLAGPLSGVTPAAGAPAPPPPAVQQPAVTRAADRTSAVADLLARRGHAVRVGNKGAFLANVDPSATEFRRRQAALFDNLAGVPLSEWRYRLDAVTEYAAVGPAFSSYDTTVWVPRVELAYALAGVDELPVVTEQVFTFVERGSGWFIAADDDLAEAGHATPRELWDFGPVQGTRGRFGLVLSHPHHASVATGLIGEVDDAVAAVTAVWGPGWAQSVAAVIPGSQEELAEIVGKDLVLDRIAAVATSTATEPVRGQRIVVNPETFTGLTSPVRRVVIRHEIAHLAVRAATSTDAPAWVAEGFADYVGYLDSGIPIRSAAADLAAAVRRGDTPSDLPEHGAFRGDDPRLGQSYQEAWLAYLLIEQRVGPVGMSRFYRAAATGPAAAASAFGDVLGTMYGQFVWDWRAFLVEQLG